MAFFKFFSDLKDKIEKEKEFSRAEKELKQIIEEENILLKTDGTIGYSYYHGVKQPSGEVALIVIDKLNSSNLLFSLTHEVGHYVSHKTGAIPKEYHNIKTTTEDFAPYESIAEVYKKLNSYERFLVFEEELRAWKFGAKILGKINFKYMIDYENYAYHSINNLLWWYGFKE